jgi:Carboxypeptidase regulatory-like domain
MLRIRRILLLPLGLALLSGVAQQATPPGRISGKVVDGKSGQALAQCVVEISPTMQRQQSLSLTTGDDGRFLFTGLPVGKYALTAAHTGYLTQSYQEHDEYSTAIAVGPAVQSEGLVFQLMPQAVVYGTITDEVGDPVRRAQVKLFQDLDSNGTRTTRQRQLVQTDDRGMYELANIGSGNYYLAVTAQPWYAHGVMRGGNGESPSALDVAYPTTFYVEATESDDATPIPVKGGERIEINVTLSPQHGMRLRLPVPVSEREGYNVALQESVFGEMQPVALGAQMMGNGVLEVDGVLPGHYEVTLSQFGANASKATHFTTDVASGATELREEAAAPDISVTGVVTFAGKRPAGAGITLVGSHPRRDYPAHLNDGGEFEMSVAPGEYEVVGQIQNYYLARIVSPNAQVKGRMVEVKGGSGVKLEIEAGTGFSHIDGIVQSRGHGVGGVMVVLVPEDARDNQILFRRDQSDSDGTFSLNNVIPGRYRLIAIQDGWDLEWAQPNVLSAFMKKSIPLQVHADEKLQQVVEMQSR